MDGCGRDDIERTQGAHRERKEDGPRGAATKQGRSGFGSARDSVDAGHMYPRRAGLETARCGCGTCAPTIRRSSWSW